MAMHQNTQTGIEIHGKGNNLIPKIFCLQHAFILDAL